MNKKRLVGAGIATVAVLAALPAALPAASTAQTVTVTLSEFHIKGVPAKLKPGATTFKVKNPSTTGSIAGLKVSEFDHFGAAARTLRTFLGAYFDLVGVIRDLRLPNPDL